MVKWLTVNSSPGVAYSQQMPNAVPCYRTRTPFPVDGNLDKSPWSVAPRSPRFVDMVTGHPGFFDTRASILWDDTNLYTAFWLEEPFVAAEQTERDSLVFLENDVEVFIDGGDSYYEFEINALGTVYEVFFVWKDAYAKSPRWQSPEFDLIGQDALSFGGDYDRQGPTFWRGTHPRGTRWAFRRWDLAGLKSAVQVDGTLNDPTTVDRGWRVELAFPWASMAPLANGRALPPRPGDRWRLFFGRFEKLMSGGAEVQPHPAWCWTPHYVFDTHMPERWTQVEFREEAVEDL